MQFVVDSLDLGSRQIDYNQAWDLQRAKHEEVVTSQSPDTALPSTATMTAPGLIALFRAVFGMPVFHR